MNECNLQIDTTNPNVRYTTVTATPDGRLTAKDASKYLGVSTSTLARMRKRHYGPAHTVVCQKIFYYLPALEEFLDASCRGVNDYTSVEYNDFGQIQRDFWLTQEFEHHLAHLPEPDISDDELHHYRLM